MRLVLVAALLLAVPFLFHAGSTVHAADNEITGVALTSPNPGELAITWDAPSRAPGDYRVTWKKSGGNWPSYKNENTALGGNAFPTGTSHTVSDLDEGTEYSVRVRARYRDGNGNVEESGPWSTAVGLTIAGLPDKPTGLSASPSHDSVLLSWTDPNDNSITGYQVLRGPDAANLTVLNNDTGSGTASYTDNTVDAETTYAYAIRAKNAQGLGPQSDAVPAVTTAAPAPPAKPTGLLTGSSHNTVLLFWTDPGDDSITGYQVLRGPDAANLAVLTEDTGSTDASYSDDTVEAETTYAYAIRARNAAGLGPQSDTVSVTTQAAPEELLTELALAGVEFIIAGQTLDTAGPCYVTDITMIADGCTHNITNPTPQFGVVGTLGSNAAVQVNIGRDLAGGSKVADQSDLQGANKRITPTFQPGRNLLQIFGDADNTISGGDETHYFQINVVPYWEWNGERLSRDSDCRDTEANAPAVGDITDDACIVTQFGNTAELRFFNVINEHFNVYVEVNGTNVISEPSTTDLGSSFTVNLDAGDNLIRIRLAAKGGQPLAEVYDSDSFYYKGTATESNDATLSGLALSDVTFVPEVDVSLNPAFDSEVTEYTATFANEQSNSYLEVTTNDDNATVEFLDENNATIATTDTSPPNFHFLQYNIDVGDTVIKIKVTAEDTTTTKTYQVTITKSEPAVSSDATLSSLELSDSTFSPPSTVALNPAFDSLVTEYTAKLTNEQSNPDLLVTTTNNNATVEFLDENDATIATTAIQTPNLHFLDSNVDVGDTVFKIKVTAEDTTTTKTYQVTVTRVDFLVSNLGQATNDPDTVTLDVATPFTTGSNPTGYTLSAVTLDIGVSPGTTPLVSIYSDSSGRPGSSLSVLTNPTNIPSITDMQVADVELPTRVRELDFEADDLKLKPDTQYWVVIARASGSGSVYVDETASTAEDAGTAPGWSMGNFGYFLVSGQTWPMAATFAELTRMAIKGAVAETPSAPASLTASPGNAEATLTWTEPASDGGHPITKYQYRVSTDGGSNWAPDWTDVLDGSDTGTDQADERTVTVTSLANGTLHTFQVRAVNSEGGGSEAQDTATPTATTTAPDAPASLTASPGNTQATLAWTAPVSDGGAAVIKYQYRVSSDSGSTWNPDWTDVSDGSDAGTDLDDERSFTVTNLINGTLYTFEVRAVNSVGSGGQRQATATPRAAGTPPDLQSAEIDGTTLTLQFSNTLDANSRPARTAFTVKVRGTAVSLASSNPVTISGSTVTLRLRSPVTAGDTVTVSYTAPGANPIKDDAALEAPSFTDEPVFNNTPNAEPTGKPVISGTPQRDETLTVSTSGIRDDDGLSNPRYSYRWVRVDGATEVFISASPTYLLTRDDIGKKIKVFVSFHDDAGVIRHLESDLFPRSGTIQNKPNRQPTGRPTLSGTYQVGHTLTASTSGIDDPDGLTNPGYTYQWQRRESGVYTDITGATAMVYTLSPEDQGKRVRVQVTFTDDDDNSHTLESFPSGVVQAQTSLPSDKVKVSLDATAYVVEEGQTVQVTVTLAEAPEEDPVYIPFTLTPGNGARRSEFDAWSSASTDSLRFAAGQTTDWIKIRPDDDTLNDDGETITLCLVDLPDPYATLAGLNCATINILDNDDPNSVRVTFRRDTYWASEDGNPAWPRISVHPVPDREITIPITFTRGGGLSASDHGAVTTSVTFGPGLYGVHGDGHLSDDRTYASFPIEIWAIDDMEDDDGEYMDLAFGDLPPFVSESGTGKFSYRPTTARVWFNDNEFTEVEVIDSTNRSLTRRMRVTFAEAELEASEGQYEIGTVATVRVQLSRPRNKESAVTIPITVTRHGTTTPADYAGADIPSSITFLPGQTEYSFRVRAVNDDIDDDGEYLTLTFGTLPELVDAGDQASVRINLVDDDDPPVQVFFEQTNYEVTSTQQEGKGVSARLQVKVKLSAVPERFIDVGIVPESIQGSGGIHFEYSAYIPRGPHDGAHFYEEDTEFTLQIYISASDGFDANQTYRLRFKGMSYKMFVGSPATATITVNPNS